MLLVFYIFNSFGEQVCNKNWVFFKIIFYFNRFSILNSCSYVSYLFRTKVDKI